MKADTYTCAMCGRTFEKGWSDEEALAELRAWSIAAPECCVTVCDDCYQLVRPDTHPAEVAAYKAELN